MQAFYKLSNYGKHVNMTVSFVRGIKTTKRRFDLFYLDQNSLQSFQY